jgi:hypothetical protein
MIVLLQAYRSYRRDVSLLTDIVRCAITFEEPRHLLDFVENWLLKHGTPTQPKPDKKTQFIVGIKHRMKRAKYFFRLFRDYIKRSLNIHDYDDSDEEVVQKQSEETKDPASWSPDILFEIMRIRNRFNLELIEAPGGYRDLSLKIKIGVTR